MDLNVFSQLRNGFFNELSSLIHQHKQDLLLFYSSAHISDINKNIDGTITDDIKSDLSYLSELTSNLCLFNDMHHKLQIDYVNPLSYLEDRIWEDGFFNQKLSTLLLSIPTDIEEIKPGITKQINDLLESDYPCELDHFNNFFPRIKSNKLRDIIDGTFDFFNELNNSDKYSELRKIAQDGFNINRDQIFNSNNPIFDINASMEKVGINYEDFMEKTYGSLKNTDCWNSQIVNTYLSIDMFGYKEDKIYVKNKSSNTFKNLSNDAFHAAFGTTCHFFITNDNRAYHKTRTTYDKLNINTVVCKPFEMLEILRQANTCKTIDDICNKVVDEFKNCEKPNKLISNDIEYYEIISRYFFFNFFNKILLPIDYETHRCIIFSTNKPNNLRINFNFELVNLSNNIDSFFNIPIDSRTPLSDNEFEKIKANSDWKRIYTVSDIELTLTQVNGFIQLYLLFL